MTAGPYGMLGSSEADSSDTPAVKSYEACMAKWNVIYLLYIPLTIGFLLYAGYRRNQMRAKFNIPGDEYEVSRDPSKPLLLAPFAGAPRI